MVMLKYMIMKIYWRYYLNETNLYFSISSSNWLIFSSCLRKWLPTAKKQLKLRTPQFGSAPKRSTTATSTRRRWWAKIPFSRLPLGCSLMISTCQNSTLWSHCCLQPFFSLMLMDPCIFGACLKLMRNALFGHFWSRVQNGAFRTKFVPGTLPTFAFSWFSSSVGVDRVRSSPRRVLFFLLMFKFICIRQMRPRTL